MTKKISLLILILAILLAVITRLYKLGEAPHGLYVDEAGQGYSAYSILKTGKDEFGMPYPFVFRSFADFKTPVYIYLIVPLIPVFGLTIYAVRFPSYFFSILTIILTYLLIIEIAPKKYKYSLACVSSLLLAVSPWHILFGRTNFECNVGLFFLLGGVYFFYLGLKKPMFIVLSSVFFAIALPAYHSQRIVAPLTLLALTLRHRKELFLKTNTKYLIIAATVGFLITLPTLSVATTPGFLARATGLNIFSTVRRTPSGTLDEVRGLSSFFVNNRMFLSSKEFLALYLAYYSPRNMFVLGDYGLRSSFPDLSTFFMWQFPFYIYGAYLFFKEKMLGELRSIVLTLFFIAPIPAAVTIDPYTTIRSIPLVIPQLIFIAFAIVYAFEKIKDKKSKYFFYISFVVILIYSIAKLYSSVIIINELYRAQAWNYGWEEVVDVITTRLDPKIPIVIDNAREDGYIQLLFFLKYDPATYQKSNNEVALSEYYTNMQRVDSRQIGNITSRKIDWTPDTMKEQYLIGDNLAISNEQIKLHYLTPITDIFYPDGSTAFRVVKTNPNLKPRL